MCENVRFSLTKREHEILDFFYKATKDLNEDLKSGVLRVLNISEVSERVESEILKYLIQPEVEYNRVSPARAEVKIHYRYGLIDVCLVYIAYFDNSQVHIKILEYDRHLTPYERYLKHRLPEEPLILKKDWEGF